MLTFGIELTTLVHNRPHRAARDLVIHWVEHVRALSLVRHGRFKESYGPQIARG